MTDKKKKEELTDQEMKKAKGGLRGAGQLEQAGGMQSRGEMTPTRMPNRPRNISRGVQGNWTSTGSTGDAPDGSEPIDETRP